MWISWKWMQEWIDPSIMQGGAEGLSDLLTGKGLEIEEIVDPSKGLEKVITAKILKKVPHPDADKLSLCTVDAGLEEGPLEIVCGAKNMVEQDVVCLAQVGAKLPIGLEIKKSKIRGVSSSGMLCSEEELGLKDSAEGILILPRSTAVGQPVARVLGLQDQRLLLKITANRGDCLSYMGVAREVASHYQTKVLVPKLLHQEKFEASKEKGSVTLKLPENASCSQFFVARFTNGKVGPSPKWLAEKVESTGMRSINNLVDISNLVMMEFGHPIHFYDADFVSDLTLEARLASRGEKLKLLDESEITLQGDELVIADSKKALGLAGVMGGAESEVRESTKNILVECAEFDSKKVRTASTRYQKRSEASSRFEKGIDPQGLPRVMSRVCELMRELSCGEFVDSTYVCHEKRLEFTGERKILFRPSYANDLLGTSFSEDQIRKSLKSIGCKISEGKDSDEVTTPSYRKDLSIPEDLVEEVARVLGYDQIPSTMPTLSSLPVLENFSASSIRLWQMDMIKDAMSSLGLCEALNFSFCNSEWVSEFGFKPTVKILNPINQEENFMTPSLIPALCKNAVHNFRNSFGTEPVSIRLFECRPVFEKAGGGEIRSESNSSTGTEEKLRLAFLLSGPKFESGLRQERSMIDFYDSLGVLEQTLKQIELKGARIVSPFDSVPEYLHPGKCVQILTGKTSLGFMGEIHPQIAKKLKFRAPVFLCEMDAENILSMMRKPSRAPQYKKISEFPSMERDFAMLVRDPVKASDIVDTVYKAARPIVQVAKIFDVYRGEQVPEGMTSLAVRVIFNAEGRSLQESEVEEASKKIIDAWKKGFDLELRS